MSKNYIDYKVTTWKRIPITDEDIIDKAIEMIQNDEINCPGELYLEFDENDIGPEETLIEVDEFISVNENQGSPTIEIYKDHKLIWDNLYESEHKRKIENND